MVPAGNKAKPHSSVNHTTKIIHHHHHHYHHHQQTSSRVNETIQPLPHPLTQLDKILLRIWNKYFLMEIYRNIQAFALTALQECSCWASRNVAGQMFFLTPNRKTLAGKFVKWERFFVVMREHIIFNVEWAEVHKMSEVFWTKLYCKIC